MKNKMSFLLAAFLLLAMLLPAVVCAEPRMDGNMYCPRCSSVCVKDVEVGYPSARSTTCPDCGIVEDRILTYVEYRYDCTNCSYYKVYATDRYYECGCGCRFY